MWLPLIRPPEERTHRRIRQGTDDDRSIHYFDIYKIPGFPSVADGHSIQDDDIPIP